MESASENDTPRVAVFPPLLFGAGLVLGLVLHFALPLPRLPRFPARIAASMLLTGSVLLARFTESAMSRAGTAVRPDRPTTALVTDGPFALSRNPLYLATAGIYAGAALFLPALWPLLLLGPVLVVLRLGVIGPEEEYLERKFGAAYAAYRARVRRWL